MIKEDEIKEHLLKPRNVGELKNADIVISHTNNVCGDSVILYAKVEGTIIKEIKYKVFGCSTTIAVSSIWSEFIKGKDIISVISKIGENVPIKKDDLEETKKHSFDLVFEAIMKLCRETKEKNKCLSIE